MAPRYLLYLNPAINVAPHLLAVSAFAVMIFLSSGCGDSGERAEALHGTNRALTESPTSRIAILVPTPSLLPSLPPTIKSKSSSKTPNRRPDTIEPNAPERPAGTPQVSFQRSPAGTAVASPSPKPTGIPLPHIESEDGDLLIMYEVATTKEDMLLDLKAAQQILTELTKLYGRPPHGQVILKKFLDGNSRESFVTVPEASIPFSFTGYEGQISGWQCGTPMHEMAHYFTANLLRTKLLWFNEGLSGIATAALTGEDTCIINLEEFDFDEVVVSHGARNPGHTASVAPSDYELLKGGTNIFQARECEDSRVEGGRVVKVRRECIRWVGAHAAGTLFFYALALDYEIDGSAIGKFVRALVELTEDGRRTGTDDLQTAALATVGKDIEPLLEYLEPAIKFNNH